MTRYKLEIELESSLGRSSIDGVILSVRERLSMFNVEVIKAEKIKEEETEKK